MGHGASHRGLKLDWGGKPVRCNPMPQNGARAVGERSLRRFPGSSAVPYPGDDFCHSGEQGAPWGGRGGGREFEATGSAGVCGEEHVDRHGKTGQAAGMRHILGTPSTGVFF